MSNFWICTAWTVISGSGPIFFDIKWLPTVQRICQKCLQWNQNFRQNTVWTKKWFRLELVSMELNHIARFTYLAIYISQKIRLCLVDFEDQFQTSLQAESINFLNAKFKSIILIFLLFFAGIVKSTGLCTLSLLFQKGWSIWVMFCVNSQLQYFNSLEQQWQRAKSSGFDNSCQK